MKSTDQRAAFSDSSQGSDSTEKVAVAERTPAPVKTPAPTRSNGGGLRELPSSVLTPPAPPPSPHLDDYKKIIGEAQVDALRFLAHELKGKTLKMVNSTAVGGG